MVCLSILFSFLFKFFQQCLRFKAIGSYKLLLDLFQAFHSLMPYKRCFKIFSVSWWFIIHRKNVNDFWYLILQPVTLVEPLISSGSFFKDSSDFVIHRWAPSVNRQFYFPFCNVMFYLIFSAWVHWLEPLVQWWTEMMRTDIPVLPLKSRGKYSVSYN